MIHSILSRFVFPRALVCLVGLSVFAIEHRVDAAVVYAISSDVLTTPEELAEGIAFPSSEEPAVVGNPLRPVNLNYRGDGGVLGYSGFSTGAIDRDQYLAFGFSTPTGFELERIVFSVSPVLGPEVVELDVSLDGGAFATLVRLDTPFSFDPYVTEVDLSGLTGRTVEFRMYGGESSRADGAFGLSAISSTDSAAIRIEGQVAAVPEPGGIALLLVFAGVHLGYRRWRVV